MGAVRPVLEPVLQGQLVGPGLGVATQLCEQDQYVTFALENIAKQHRAKLGYLFT